MNDFFRISADSVGISITSEPVSIYLSWATIFVAALALVAVRVVRQYRARKAVTSFAPATEQAVTDADGYAW